MLEERRAPGEYLSHLSTLAGCGFASTQDAMQAIVRLLTEQLGMRSGLVTRIVCAEGGEAARSEIVAAHNLPGGCDIPKGAVIPFPLTF